MIDLLQEEKKNFFAKKLFSSPPAPPHLFQKTLIYFYSQLNVYQKLKISTENTKKKEIFLSFCTVIFSNALFPLRRDNEIIF